MKKTKQTSWTILDKMWDNIHSVNPSTKWREFAELCSESNTEEWIKNNALEKFLFESRYLFSKPNRDTIKWLWGSHAELYDIFGCKEHRFVCRTSDSCDEYIDGLTVFCPECNEAHMTAEKKNKYIELVRGKFCSVEEWKSYEKRSKWEKSWNRKQNFKYWLKKWTEKGYLQYRISSLFKKQ